MKIKYMYQLLISQLSIIITAFLILSLIFSHYLESVVYDSKVQDLAEKGEAILLEHSRADTVRAKQHVLSQYSNVLRMQSVHITMLDAEGRVVPNVLSGPSRFRMMAEELQHSRFRLTDEEWQHLRHGEVVAVRRDQLRFEQAVSLVALPDLSDGELSGGILLVSPVSSSREMISQINQYLLYTVAIALLVSLLLSLLLANLHVSRIKKIRSAVSAISTGNYDFQIPASSIDEIGELVNDFNHMARKLKASQEEIEALENRRKQFMADVSHELRTPLTTISGVIEGLKNDMITEEEKEKGIQLVSQETKRLIRLVSENLDYEKIRSNQVTLHKQHVVLREVFEIIHEYLFLQLEDSKNCLVIEIDPGTVVYADYDRLIQILINITQNAIQFTEQGTIWLRGRTEKGETVIEIEDTGTGVDPQVIEQIWHRFYKADLSRKRNLLGGFGLGLAIVKQLVQLHQGKIDVQSEKDRGTKFVIRLPLAPES